MSSLQGRYIERDGLDKKFKNYYYYFPLHEIKDFGPPSSGGHGVISFSLVP